MGGAVDAGELADAADPGKKTSDASARAGVDLAAPG